MVDTFPIVPADTRALWPLAGVLLLLLAVSTLLLLTARATRNATFELSAEGLRLRGDLYGRVIPAGALDGASARLVDLSVEPELQPRRRTAGTSLGGYLAGWFRLRNGEKALLYVTDRRRTVYVRTTKGYSVLLSPREPERFLARLKDISR